MKYFAYGSNMDPDRMIKRKVKFLDRKHAILKDYSLQFNKIALSNPEKEGKANIMCGTNELVEGVLYEIESSDEIKLDRNEVYPKHYDKDTISVQLDDGTIIDTMTYIAQPNMIKEGLRPTREYLDHLLAAKDMLSKSYYEKLKSWPALD